jgi:tetratricopeptide (TPR) repeat protein
MMKPFLLKLVFFSVALLVLAGIVLTWWLWQDRREVAFIRSLAGRHPQGETFVQEILSARQKLRDLDPKNDFAALLQLGVNHNLLGEKEKALSFYFQALKKDPTNILALNNAGEIYSDLGNYQKAEEFWLKLVEDYPTEPSFYRKLGNLYRYRLNKTPAQIEEFFQKGLEQTDNHIDLLSWLVNYFLEIGDNVRFAEYANLLSNK